MLHVTQSPHVQQSRLTQPITLDDFVAVFMVSLYPQGGDPFVYLAGNAEAQDMLTVDNGNVSLSWDTGRGNVCNSSGSVPNGVSLVRISLQNGDWKMAWTGQAEQACVVGGDQSTNPITFDLIGATGIDRPNQAGYSTPGCHVLAAVIMPGHPTAEDVARVEVGLAGYQLS